MLFISHFVLVWETHFKTMASQMTSAWYVLLFFSSMPYTRAWFSVSSFFVFRWHECAWNLFSLNDWIHKKEKRDVLKKCVENWSNPDQLFQLHILIYGFTSFSVLFSSNNNLSDPDFVMGPDWRYRLYCECFVKRKLHILWQNELSSWNAHLHTTVRLYVWVRVCASVRVCAHVCIHLPYFC